MVVAFVPGGITDVIGRAVARQLESMGQPVIVENRGGANGQLGSALVAKATPDGAGEPASRGLIARGHYCGQALSW